MRYLAFVINIGNCLGPLSSMVHIPKRTSWNLVWSQLIIREHGTENLLIAGIFFLHRFWFSVFKITWQRFNDFSFLYVLQNWSIKMHYNFNVATNQTGLFDYASVKLYLTDPILHFSIQMTKFQACIPSRFKWWFHIYSLWTKVHVSERFTTSHSLRKILPFDSI